MNQPIISVFLPTFTRYAEGYLARAVGSLLAQTSRDFELIVIDDGSMDGSADYLASLTSSDARVKHIRSERNTGLPALALASAYKHAQGSYFAWLFDDCELRQGHLEKLAQSLDTNPEWGMVYARAEVRLSADSTFEVGKPFDIAVLESGTNFIPNVCVMIRRSTIDRIGWYDPHVVLKRLCDWDLWLRVAHQFEIGFVDQVLATEHGVGLVSSLGRANDLDHGLVMKYAATDRDGRLAPDGLTRDDCFRRDIEESLTSAEKHSFEFAIFEHALQTMDEALVAEAVEQLNALGALDALKARYVVQQRAAPTAQSMTMLASLAYVQRRSARSAQALIEAEEQTRATLSVAGLRLEHIDALEREVAAVRITQEHHTEEARAALTALSTTRKELNVTHETLQRYRKVADQRLEHINALESEVAKVRTIQAHNAEEARAALGALEVTREELRACNETLQTYRHVADQRLALLDEANQNLTFWSELANERLRIIEASSTATTDAQYTGVHQDRHDEG